MTSPELVLTNVRVVHHNHPQPQDWDVAVTGGVITAVGPDLGTSAPGRVDHGRGQV